jgi:hypothetical protein
MKSTPRVVFWEKVDATRSAFQRWRILKSVKRVIRFGRREICVTKSDHLDPKETGFQSLGTIRRKKRPHLGTITYANNENPSMYIHTYIGTS